MQTELAASNCAVDQMFVRGNVKLLGSAAVAGDLIVAGEIYADDVVTGPPLAAPPLVSAPAGEASSKLLLPRAGPAADGYLAAADFMAFFRKQNRLPTASQSMFLAGDLTFRLPPAPPAISARVKTVGLDAPTIQGCIDLCVNPSLDNMYVVRIPFRDSAGNAYVENLSLPGCVELRGMGTTIQASFSRPSIMGLMTLALSTEPINNVYRISNLNLNQSNFGTLMSFSGLPGAVADVQVVDCSTYVFGVSVNVAFKVPAGVTLRVEQSVCYFTGNSGRLFDVQGGVVYFTESESRNGGEQFFLTAGGAATIQNSTLSHYYPDSSITVNAGCRASVISSTLRNDHSGGSGVKLSGADSRLTLAASVVDVVASGGYAVYSATTGAAAGTLFIAGASGGNAFPRNSRVGPATVVSPLSTSLNIVPSF
jgi:hypothetical protein